MLTYIPTFIHSYIYMEIYVHKFVHTHTLNNATYLSINLATQTHTMLGTEGPQAKAGKQTVKHINCIESEL